MDPIVQQLRSRVAALEAENERLRREASSVADANARAAMEILAIGDGRQLELEAKNREIAAALDRAEEALRQKSRFLANMSHELRTPLNGILGMAELLQNSELDGRQRDFVQSIAGSADTFLEMVNELLDFSKIEAGKLELENSEFDLWVVADAVAQDLQLRCDTKGLEFCYYLAPELPRRVRGDALRLRQVMLNLGSNAVKFTDRGSVQLELTFEPATATMAAYVRDTGCGIDAAVAPRLFQPFVQADVSTTRNFGGTGLGLAISRQLARRMGGDIRFTSAPRVGTEFLLQLPIAVATDPAAAAVVAAPAARGTAAVVARQPSTQRLLADHLPALGYRLPATVDGQRVVDLLIVEALGGEAAIEGLERMRPDGAGPPLLLILPPHHTIAPPRLSALGVIGVLVLPVRPTQLAAQLQPPQPVEVRRDAGASSCGAHVLVAEDIQVNRKVIEAQLTRLGCRVTSVDNGESAVQAAIGQVFDMILMDCQMPRLDGQQATMAIRALEAGRNRRTPVVALTANALPGDREACLAAGMDDYLSKPLRQADLVAMLQRWHILQA